VVFYNGRSTFQQEHTALDLVRQNQVDELLFPTSDITRSSDNNDINTKRFKFKDLTIAESQKYNLFFSLKFFNRKINLEQSIAIKNILLNSAFPLPYIIYGPPGQ
jgi:hypothetical protein